jgi:hypothetical protein
MTIFIKELLNVYSPEYTQERKHLKKVLKKIHQIELLKNKNKNKKNKITTHKIELYMLLVIVKNNLIYNKMISYSNIIEKIIDELDIEINV